ncbi:hypothetical protein RhiXN_01754 [Rhizoctonia solani]|uniref:Uncharacterized protein n=1 Tax=Rhizoctonia solani TaxID=456999 RepID=A0A8H8T3E4_9AGAM|nr:uncharacterized protein RhiXN_01754 [Rhizoctonia solani]QRW27159.1 hypothetical protein RhiXN_01754 [Rhizoctonia solani]
MGTESDRQVHLHFILRRSAERTARTASRRLACQPGSPHTQPLRTGTHSYYPFRRTHCSTRTQSSPKLVRRDQRHVRARPAAGARRVLQRRLEQRAVLAVEPACSGLEVCDGGDERAVADVVAAGRQHATALDQEGCGKCGWMDGAYSTVSASVVKVDDVTLCLDADGSDEGDGESGEESGEAA